MLACASMAIATPATAASVEINNLSDVAFGTITNFGADAVNAQSVCVFAKSPPGDNYNITASGSGTGGAFLLSSGSANLPYDVQWADTPSKSVGTQLVANQPLTGQHSNYGNGNTGDCSRAPVPGVTASLIVILRSQAISAASSGNYSGTLTLLVAPE